ncbi:WG repeat-containing protein, partial [Picosynechococcus sp. NKBG042902]|uniref:WG repeat-containing protein n=2 Tax=Picosynechococcus sp. NKBG042902 TaxID=490193 RepID=UPI0004AABED7
MKYNSFKALSNFMFKFILTSTLVLPFAAQSMVLANDSVPNSLSVAQKEEEPLLFPVPDNLSLFMSCFKDADDVGWEISSCGIKIGFINRQGQFVIPPTFNNASSFSEGLAAVMINDKWGFINKQAQIVIPPTFDDAYSFSEGLAKVEINDKWGFINKQGQIVIPPTFDFTSSFSEGLAKVE